MERPAKAIIANISGFYGDRLSAAKEMIEGGAVHYLTGDYLAELTMAILYKSKAKNPDAGYAKTFVKQMEMVMGTCLEKGIKVVVNAGGLNPSGLAKSLTSLGAKLGLHPKIAYIEGDDLMPRIDTFKKEGIDLKHLEKDITLSESELMPVSANAYLGCWGIVEALNEGADIVVTGRVADTSVVMGPAAYHFGWQRNDLDALAGAAAVGHIIECGGQACGGNYSFFEEVSTYINVGFPLAEIAKDGSAIISKHKGTGGLVSIGTVTSQLMYEINAPAYITPDVVAHFDTIQLTQESENRVGITGVKGTAPTPTSKVTVNCIDGFQNSMTFQIVGLQNEVKARILEQSILDQLGGADVIDEIEFVYKATDKTNPNSNEEAMATLQVSVKDKDPQKAGKFFTSKLIELALCMVPGVCWSRAPEPAKPRIVHFPALLNKAHLSQSIFVDGKLVKLDEKSTLDTPFLYKQNFKSIENTFNHSEMVETYLGSVYAARSGDKGGNANLGVWGKNAKEYAYLRYFLTIEKLKELLPDSADFEIIRYEFPNLFGLNFYIKGILQQGVAASTRVDPQAKTLGEYLRAKKVFIPTEILGNG